jgi:hypothetical protein
MLIIIGFQCACAVAGLFYVFEKHVCFDTSSSNSRKIVIALDNVADIGKYDTNGIQLITNNNSKYTFTNFDVRDEAYMLVLKHFSKCHAGMKSSILLIHIELRKQFEEKFYQTFGIERSIDNAILKSKQSPHL